uniref:ATPase H+ transporting V0 subunit d1 n=1 Tax=Sus scrofa TaxID=9823 RepID=A0A4X1UJU7_PIG
AWPAGVGGPWPEVRARGWAELRRVRAELGKPVLGGFSLLPAMGWVSTRPRPPMAKMMTICGKGWGALTGLAVPLVSPLVTRNVVATTADWGLGPSWLLSILTVTVVLLASVLLMDSWAQNELRTLSSPSLKKKQTTLQGQWNISRILAETQSTTASTGLWPWVLNAGPDVQIVSYGQSQPVKTPRGCEELAYLALLIYKASALIHLLRGRARDLDIASLAGHMPLHCKADVHTDRRAFIITINSFGTELSNWPGPTTTSRPACHREELVAQAQLWSQPPAQHSYLCPQDPVKGYSEEGLQETASQALCSMGQGLQHLSLTVKPMASSFLAVALPKPESQPGQPLGCSLFSHHPGPVGNARAFFEPRTICPHDKDRMDEGQVPVHTSNLPAPELGEAQVAQ